jgi:hypothetical protein
MAFIIAAALWIATSLVVATVAAARGKNVLAWFGLSLIVSPLITLLALLALPSEQPGYLSCPHCGEAILPTANVCPHCRLPLHAEYDAVRRPAVQDVPESDLQSRIDPVWHLARAGRAHGPISQRDLLRLAAEGKLGSDDLVWKPGFEDWRTAAAVPGLLTPPAAPRPPTEPSTNSDQATQGTSPEPPANPDQEAFSAKIIKILLGCLLVAVILVLAGVLLSLLSD